MNIRQYLVVPGLAFAVAFSILAPCMAASSQPEPVQTIVFMRHGEKPAAGLGQLSCQGLNRALALPPVLARLFGRPDRLFAPDPAKRKEDEGTEYDYIRPLATIEPTAIAAGLPVDTSVGFDDLDGLKKALAPPPGHPELVFVAWEHKQIVKLLKSLIKAGGGDKDQVPKWKGEEFDSLYILRRPVSGSGRVTFERLEEGLDGQPQTCPGQQG
ncbi:hypothetical protein [Neorhizobium sp. NCHU2750]|uniref:hypothetical protein n=1 Tax=Neorhizobium sp. NCHU2750 TaxID=1825976 RepID=UPI000EB6BE20|nr:hypothetical protein NCHU2750_40930 [Neorhizobium sp. NCHU2750]